MIRYAGKLKNLAKNLRRNMTDAERRLWSRVRGKQLKGFQFYRQKPIDEFIVDFYCPKARLVIELDGGQHYEEKSNARDKDRDERLHGMGLKVLRFSNRDVMEKLDAVIESIWSNL
jgi:very-short-patch-repair endonuclease